MLDRHFKISLLIFFFIFSSKEKSIKECSSSFYKKYKSSLLSLIKPLTTVPRRKVPVRHKEYSMEILEGKEAMWKHGTLSTAGVK